MRRRAGPSIVLAALLTALAIAGPAAGDEAHLSDDAVERRALAYSLYLDAYDAASRGEGRRARELLARVLELDPGAARVRSTLARFCLGDGDIVCAENEARRAIDLSEADADGHKVLAQLALARYQRRGDVQLLDEGLGHLRSAVEVEPQDEGLWMLLIRVLGTEGRIDEAAGEARRAASIPGADPARPWLALARSLLSRGDKERAVEILESLDLPGASGVPLLRLLADLKGGDGDYEGQARALEQLRALRPDDADVARGLGEALLRVGDAYAALQPLRAAQEVEGPDPVVARDMARALVALGRGEEALGLFASLPELYVTPPVLLVWAKALEQAGRPAEAADRIEQVIEGLSDESRESLEPSLALRAARVRVRAGQPDPALRLLASLGDDPTVLKLRLEALEALEAGGGPARADEEFRRAEKRSPDSPGILALKAVRVADETGAAAGVELMREALASSDDARSLLFGSVRRLLGWGRTELAESLIDTAPQGSPDDVARLRVNAIVLNAAGRTAEAEAIFRSLLASAPDDHELLNELGYMLASEGRELDEAVRLLERALALNPGEAAYLDSLGWALFRSGRPLEALPLLRRAAREAGEAQIGVIREHLGDVYMALGQTERALAEWRAALSFGSEDPETLRAKLERHAGDSAIEP